MGVVLLLVWWAVLNFLAVRDSSDLKQGIVRPVTRSFLPFIPVVPWRVWPAQIRVAADPAAPNLSDIAEDCLFYLGESDGIDVLYDSDLDRSLRIPSSRLVLIVLARGQREECPQ